MLTLDCDLTVQAALAQMAILRALTMLCCAGHDAVVLVGERSSIIPAIIVLLGRRTEKLLGFSLGKELDQLECVCPFQREAQILKTQSYQHDRSGIVLTPPHRLSSTGSAQEQSGPSDRVALAAGSRSNIGPSDCG